MPINPVSVVIVMAFRKGVVGEIADQVVVMREGIVREDGPTAQIFAQPKDPYTLALLACRPSLDARPRRLPVIDDFLSADGSKMLAPVARP